MRNNVITRGKRADRGAGSPGYFGWCDFAAGSGFRPEYEISPRIWQLNYEQGRQRAASVKAALGYVPVWKASAKLQTVAERHPQSGAFIRAALEPAKLFRE